MDFPAIENYRTWVQGGVVNCSHPVGSELLGTTTVHDLEHVAPLSYFQGLAINAAISAIDIALWYIKGKMQGQPVHVLPGGPARTSARVYAHVYGKTIERVLEECLAKRDAGFTAPRPSQSLPRRRRGPGAGGTGAL